MTIVLDTSGLLAAMDATQRFHDTARAVLERTRARLALSPFVLAELDYLVSTRVGSEAEVALLGEVGRGAYRLEPFSPEDVLKAKDLIERYGDSGIGLADASNVVLAHRHNTLEIFTLDERHFRALRGPGDKPFRLLPLDA